MESASERVIGEACYLTLDLGGKAWSCGKSNALAAAAAR
jgi:hypothetical protein